MAASISLIIGMAAVFASMVPVALGMARLRQRTPPMRVLWVWLALGMLTNLAMTVSALRSRETSLISQLTFLGLGLLGLYAVTGFVTGAGRRLCYAAMVIYVPIWSWRFLAGEAGDSFSRVSGPVLWILLTGVAALLVGSRLPSLEGRPLRDPGMLVGFAVMVSYAPAAALEPVSFQLFSGHPELTRWLYAARGLLLIVGYFLFTLAFLWTTPPRSSSGSSSSVA
jgi:hypothetical protein